MLLHVKELIGPWQVRKAVDSWIENVIISRDHCTLNSLSLGSWNLRTLNFLVGSCWSSLDWIKILRSHSFNIIALRCIRVWNSHILHIVFNLRLQIDLRFFFKSFNLFRSLFRNIHTFKQFLQLSSLFLFVLIPQLLIFGHETSISGLLSLKSVMTFVSDSHLFLRKQLVRLGIKIGDLVVEPRGHWWLELVGLILLVPPDNSWRLLIVYG